MPDLFMIDGPFSPGGSASVLSIIETHVASVMRLVDRVVADRVALTPDPAAAPSCSRASADFADFHAVAR